MTDRQKTFGQVLRARRIAKGYSLRKFAELVDVSPTYLSQVERDKVESPPTVERLNRMADVLGESRDEFVSFAGRVPEDLPRIIQSRPDKFPELLRTTKGLKPDQLRELIERAKEMKKKED
jgi:transcriptional regulator with XRE-family HTH domain